MKQGTKFLLLWLFSAIILSTLFRNPMPPGGATWPYYLLMASIPVGALVYARFPGKASAVFLYGLVAGHWFAGPVVDEAMRPVRGAPTVEAAMTNGWLLAIAMALVCCAAFALGQRFSKREQYPHDQRPMLRQNP